MKVKRFSIGSPLRTHKYASEVSLNLIARYSITVEQSLTNKWSGKDRKRSKGETI